MSHKDIRVISRFFWFHMSKSGPNSQFRELNYR